MTQTFSLQNLTMLVRIYGTVLKRSGESSYPCLVLRGKAVSLLVTKYAVGCRFFLGSCFFFLRATPAAYGGSQARGRTGATAAGLHHSHSNAGSEPHLQPIPQLTATTDP